MRVLLTGASGFIGGHTAAALRGAGHQLRLLTRAGSDLSRLEDLEYERIVVDLDGDCAGLADACARIDAVVHVAARLRGRTADEFRRTNAEATWALAKAARSAGAERFVFLSSLAAQGPAPSEAALPTDAAPRPVSDYGRSKLAGERSLLEIGGDMTIAIVRAPLVYGPADRGLLAFFQMAERGIALQLGSGGNRVATIYGPDLAEALTILVTRPLSGNAVWQISDGGGAYSWRELLAALARTAGRRLITIPLPAAGWAALAAASECWAGFTGGAPLLDRARVAEMRQRAWPADGTALEAATGWHPRTAMVDGLVETMRWYRREGWV